jgi:CRISPR/Cas system-associated exonuclease Cas4 (RecB family)
MPQSTINQLHGLPGAGKTQRLIIEAVNNISNGEHHLGWLLASPAIHQQQCRNSIPEAVQSSISVVGLQRLVNHIAQRLNQPAPNPLPEWQGQLWLSQILNTLADSQQEPLLAVFAQPERCQTLYQLWLEHIWQQEALLDVLTSHNQQHQQEITLNDEHTEQNSYQPTPIIPLLITAFEQLLERCQQQQQVPLCIAIKELYDQEVFIESTRSFEGIHLCVDDVNDPNRWPPLVQALLQQWAVAKLPLTITTQPLYPLPDWVKNTPTTLLPGPTPLTGHQQSASLLGEIHHRGNHATIIIITDAFPQYFEVEGNQRLPTPDTETDIVISNVTNECDEETQVIQELINTLKKRRDKQPETDSYLAAILFKPGASHSQQQEWANKLQLRLNDNRQLSQANIINSHGQRWFTPEALPPSLLNLYWTCQWFSQPNDTHWQNLLDSLLNLSEPNLELELHEQLSNYLTLHRTAEPNWLQNTLEFLSALTTTHLEKPPAPMPPWVDRFIDKGQTLLSQSPNHHLGFLLNEWEALISQAQEESLPEGALKPNSNQPSVIVATWPDAAGLTVEHVWLPELTQPSTAENAASYANQQLLSIMCQATRSLHLSWPQQRTQNQKQSPNLPISIIDNVAQALNQCIKTAPKAKKTANTSENTHHHPWRLLSQTATNTSQPVWLEQKPVSLSASSIKTYMQCPRQFFYRHWLNVPTAASNAQQFGLLLHTLLEVFNKLTQQRLTDGTFTPDKHYSGQAIKELLSIWAEPSPQPDSPFTDEQHQQWHKKLSLSEQTTLKRALDEAITELDNSGYFTNIPSAILAEAPTRFSLPETPDTLFTGSIDVLAQAEGSGQWHVLDYKTDNAKKWRGDDGKNQQKLATALTSLPDIEADISQTAHDDLFNKVGDRNYQIPLYYAATQYDDQLKQKLNAHAKDDGSIIIDRVGLQVVRPPIGIESDDGDISNANGSATSLEVSVQAARLNNSAEVSLMEIDQRISQPLKAAKQLQANPGQACRLCDYTDLCPAFGSNDDDNTHSDD